MFGKIITLIIIVISIISIFKAPSAIERTEVKGIEVYSDSTNEEGEVETPIVEKKDLLFEVERFKNEQLGSKLSYNAVEGVHNPLLDGECVTGIRHFVEYYLGIETYIAGDARDLFEDFENNYFGHSGQFTKIDGHSDVKVGDIYFKTHNEYGHVGIVYEVHEDGTYTGLDSNYHGNQLFELVTERFNFEAGFGRLNERPRISDIDGVIRYNQ